MDYQVAPLRVLKEVDTDSLLKRGMDIWNWGLNTWATVFLVGILESWCFLFFFFRLTTAYGHNQ